MPNALNSLIFPVNESIWEHNKLISLSFFIIAVIELFNNDEYTSKTFKILNSAIMCIIFTDLIFYTLFYLLEMKHNLYITIIIYTFTIFISLSLGEKIEIKKDKKSDFLSLLGFLLIGLCLAYFTYNPPNFPIFNDF